MPGDADIQGEGGGPAEPDGVLTAPEVQPVAPAGTSGPAEEAAAGASATDAAEREVLAASASLGLATMPMLPALSGLFLLAGLGLLVLRLAGRRLGA